MSKYWASGAVRAATAGRPSIATDRDGGKVAGVDRRRPRPRPGAMALAVCAALGLSACGGGGGGGSNVKPTPPPPVVDTSPMVVSSDLAVASGQTITRPLVLDAGVDLDNQGVIGGALAVAVEAKADGTILWNHGTGRIAGNQVGVRMDGQGYVKNGDGASIVSGQGVGVEVLNPGRDTGVYNLQGGTIRGATVGILLQHGGIVRNEAGAVIEATGTGGNCGAGVRCAIFVGEEEQHEPGAIQLGLLNEGTIIGSVQMSGTARNGVTLGAGGVIQGDLLIGSNPQSVLSIGGDAGTVQRYSAAVTGHTTFSGILGSYGAGTWIIDTDELKSAATSIEEGTLQVGDGGTTGSIGDGPVQLGNGKLVYNRSDDVLLTADITARFPGDEKKNGTIVQAGTGMLTLAGTNVLPYFIVIEAGTLRWGNTGDQPFSTNWAHNAANVDNRASLVFDSNDLISWDGGISGAGSVSQDGSGLLYFPDAKTYTGGTTVNAGYLVAEDLLLGNLAINSGGQALAPRIAGDVVNGGILDARGQGWAHGQDFGDTVVEGDYHQSAGGTLLARLGARLDVQGTATLDGGTLEVAGAMDGYIANTHTEVLTAAGGVTGTFDRLVKAAGVVFTSSTIHYDANSVWLDTTGLDITTAAAGDGIGYTPASMDAAERVQGAFEQLNGKIATDALAGVSADFLRSAGQFQRAPTIEAAQASLRSLSGELHAASAAMTFRAIDAGNRALSDHLNALRDGHAAAGMWTQQLGSGGAMARSGYDGVGFRMDGWLVGNDFRLGRSGVVGFAFGQGQGMQQLQGGFDRDGSRRTEGMVYAGLAGDRWYAQGRLGFGAFRQDVSRALLLGNRADGVWTRYGGRYQVAYGEGGLRYDVGNLRITPFAGLQYARSERDAFEEAGAGGFGLRSDAQAMARWQADLGVRASHRWHSGKGRTLDLGAHAQWFRADGAGGDAMDASFVGLQQWSPLLGIGVSRYGSLFGVGLDARLSPSATLRLAYDYERGQFDAARGMTAAAQLTF